MILPAISLWQPWASACMRPDLKVHETRHWPAPPRLIGKRFAVHAAAKPIPRDLDEEVAGCMADAFGPDWRSRLPRGAIIGTAVLTSSVRMGLGANPAHTNDYAFGDWTPGRYGWRLDDVEPLAEPIPAKGRQGWFTVEMPA